MTTSHQLCSKGGSFFLWFLNFPDVAKLTQNLKLPKYGFLFFNYDYYYFAAVMNFIACDGRIKITGIKVLVELF